MNYLKKIQTTNNYNFINDTVFAQGSELKICENEIKKIDEIISQIFSMKKIEDKKLNFLFSDLEIYSNIVFENLLRINKELYFQLFVEEIKRKYFESVNEIRVKLYKQNSTQLFNKNDSLFKEGFYFGELKKKTVDSIIKISEKYLNSFYENIKKGKTNRNNLSINTGADIRKIIKLINFEFNQNGTNSSVSNYMQNRFEVIGCSLELSTENSTWWKWDNQKEISKHTLYAHVDENLFCPKSICYLSNVGKLNGPTSFYPNVINNLDLNFMQNIIGRTLNSIGSSKNSKLFKIYKKKSNRAYETKLFFEHINKLPKNLKFDSHIGWYIKNNSFLERKFIDNEIVMKGEPGKFVVFDGSKVFHRGGCIDKGQRLVLQLTFGEKINFFQKILRKIPRMLKK